MADTFGHNAMVSFRNRITTVVKQIEIDLSAEEGHPIKIARLYRDGDKKKWPYVAASFPRTYIWDADRVQRFHMAKLDVATDKSRGDIRDVIIEKLMMGLGFMDDIMPQVAIADLFDWREKEINNLINAPKIGTIELRLDDGDSWDEVPEVDETLRHSDLAVRVYYIQC